MPTLAELKKLVKEHSTDKPKLSAGKEALLLYAEKAGLLKKGEAPVAEPVAKAVRGASKKAEALPDVLLKPEPVEKKTRFIKKIVEEIEPVKTKSASSFAEFMKANKGSGMKMTELAEMYKLQK